MTTAGAAQGRLAAWMLPAMIVAAFVAVAGAAMLHTSTTFDEIVFAAIGARGFETGHFDLVLDHPRLPQYLFGLPVWLTSPRFPSEAIALQSGGLAEYAYARAFFWEAGNDPQRLAFAMRWVGLVFGALTVAFTFVFSRRHMGVGAATFAAALVALVPDMLAHSGVAYTDVPLTFGFLASVYALDRAARDPRPAVVAIAALSCAFTVSLKYSGVVLAPIAVALVAAEAASGRWTDRAWRRSILVAVAFGLAVAWIAIAVIGQGDWMLDEFASRFRRSLAQTGSRDSFLWGSHYLGGRWYFFPVALALKTPAAFHVLVLVAIAGAWSAWRHPQWKALLSHGARAPLLGFLFFLAATVTVPLNIGTRHALPLMPLACILVAQGVAIAWDRGRRALRVAVGVAFTAVALSSLRYYPYFLSYLNEYASGRPMYETLVDSSTDWGHGLIGLRDFMHEHEIDSIGLGYFGSAMPEGYGIRYAAMPSYFPLQHPAVGPEAPPYIAISASLLAGTASSDPYAEFRRAKPLAVVGGSLYVFELGHRQP